MRKNMTLLTDAYKVTHWLQRPENMTALMSYMEFRKGGTNSANVLFGMNYLLKEYFMTKVTQDDITRGIKRTKQVFGTERYYAKEIWEKVAKLGYFPLKVRAAKEGSLIATGNALFTIEATEPWFAPMVSHFEDILMWSWITSGVATRIFNIRKNYMGHGVGVFEVLYYDVDDEC